MPVVRTSTRPRTLALTRTVTHASTQTSTQTSAATAMNNMSMGEAAARRRLSR